MKKIVSLVLAISMVLSMFVSAFAATFEDVEGTEYAGAVEALVELGVINGLPDGTYGPEKDVTRAELAKMLVLCLGLEDTVTKLADQQIFEDVKSEEWHAGYVNAAAQAKVIAGYPDGTFKPTAKVSYAEAYTMIIRALGYGNVVDKEGTWPTAYMLKAVELGLDKDVKDDKADQPAKRGNIAIMLWNMLRTKMWKITSENEGTGMTSEPSSIMLNVKFPDYSYGKVLFEGYEIEDADEAAEVRISFEDVEGSYIYEGNDFFTFVPGTEVEVLVNEEEELLLTIVPTGEDRLVEGQKDEIDEDYDELKEVAYDYAYARIVKRAIDNAAVITTTSEYVDKVEVKSDYMRINGTKYEFDDVDYNIYLKDGERVALKDIEVGEILTTVNVGYEDSAADTFYVIGVEEAEGELTKYAEVKFENSDMYFEQLTASKVKYPVAAGATFVEDPEAKTVKDLVLADHYESDMKGEEVVLKLDAFTGKVVRIEFDGKIDAGDDEDTTIAFYGVTAGVDKDGRTYNIELENEEGSDGYDFAKSSEAESSAKEQYANGFDATGSFIVAELDEDGKVINLALVADYEGGLADITEVVYGDKAEDEYYAIVEYDSASFDDEEPAIVNDADAEDLVKVNDSTVLVTLVFDDKGTDKVSDDEYRVEFEEGLEALEDVKEEHVVVIYDADSSFTRAKYVLVWSDTSDKSDNQVALIANGDEVVLVGGNMIELEDNDGEVTEAKIANGTKDLSLFELVVYTLTTNSKDEDIFNFIAGLHEGELRASNTNHGYVGECDDDRTFLLNDSEEVNIDAEKYEDYQDFMIVLVEVSETEDDEDLYEVTGFETIDFEDVSLTEGDRISIREDEEIIFLIHGMDVREEDANA